MTDRDRPTTETETQEALAEPGREQLRHMRHLANTMVWKLGDVDEENSTRTMAWQGEPGYSYYLGYGEWWDTATGEATGEDRWLMIEPETDEPVFHRIAPDNDTLANNQALRQEVAAVLQDGVARHLLGLAATAIPSITEGQPGRAAILHEGTVYNLKVFADAADPFMFVDVDGVRYDLGLGVPLERTDPTQRSYGGKYIEGTPEERLIHMLNVIHDGQPFASQAARRPETAARTFSIDLPENLDLDQRWVVAGAMETIAEWWEGDGPDELDLWEETANEYGLRTVVPDLWEGQPAAVGMVVQV